MKTAPIAWRQQVDPNSNRMPELRRTFGQQKTETDGREIDLRLTPEEIAKAGTEDVAFELVAPGHASPPKYDPVTGELVRPLTIQPDLILDTPASQIPVASPILHYASARTSLKHIGEVHNPFVALFCQPICS